MPEGITRKEHLAWCKKRALEYVDRGEFIGAISSMISDLRKHPETVDHVGIELLAAMTLTGYIITDSDARRAIEGFN